MLSNKQTKRNLAILLMAVVVVFSLPVAATAQEVYDVDVPEEPHMLGPSTKFIPSDLSIGTWDSVNRVYTLTTNVSDTILIDEDNLTLDGDSYTVSSPWPESGYGVYLPGRTGVTVKNVNVQGFFLGIYLAGSSGNTLSANTTSNNRRGIQLNNGSIDNTLAQNTANSNGYCGIYVYDSNSNLLTSNTANSNTYDGIELMYSGNSTLTGNTANGNGRFGIGLGWGTDECTVTRNTVSNNKYGIRLWQSKNNQIYNNNFIDNETQVDFDYVYSNVWNQPKPIGGNYWSDWTSPDNDADGFVDNAYVIFQNRMDHFPWVSQDGWLAVGSTPSGTDVVVEPVYQGTGETPVTLTFDNVTEGGVTTVSLTVPSEEQGAPEGFKFGNPPVIFEITTTAEFTDSITVCFNYSGASYGNEANLKLFHRTDGAWVDITNPDNPPDNPNPDTINKIICGTVTSLSFFGIFELEDPVVLLQALAGKVFGLNLQQGISNSLDAKLDAALKAIDDINANNDVAAINTLQAFINAVQAQWGNKISEADADALIVTAQQIIDLLSSE